MNFNEVMETRRAVNFFDTTRDVSDDMLKSVIESAAKAPSSFNLQPWNLIVLRDMDEKLRLQKLAMNQPKVSEAPVTLIVLADRDGWKEGNPGVEKVFQESIKSGIMTENQREWFSGARANLYGKDNDSIQAFACKNTGFFAMSIMLAAKSMDLDTHPMDGFDHDGVKKEFNVPENYHIPLLISLGFFNSEKKIAPPKWRKSYEDIVVSF